MIEYLVMVPIAYLIGSIPFGLLAGKLVAKVDIREYGSGKIGMTNVLSSGPQASPPRQLCFCWTWARLSLVS